MQQSKYRILSTRSLDPLLIKEAKEHGIDLETKEFISIQPVISDKLKEEIEEIVRQPDVNVVFTSRNAVDIIGRRYLQQEESYNENDAAQRWNIYCLQEVTLAAVQQYFRKGQVKGIAFSAASLAEKILENRQIGSVVFFCGNKRRDTLPTRLKKAGVHVREIIVYETVETPRTAGDDYDAVLFSSPSAVASFFSKNRLPQKTICFAIGDTTGEAIRAYTDNKIVISDSASVEAMTGRAIAYFDHLNQQE